MITPPPHPAERQGGHVDPSPATSHSGPSAMVPVDEPGLHAADAVGDPTIHVWPPHPPAPEWPMSPDGAATTQILLKLPLTLWLLQPGSWTPSTRGWAPHTLEKPAERESWLQCHAANSGLHGQSPQCPLCSAFQATTLIRTCKNASSLRPLPGQPPT